MIDKPREKDEKTLAKIYSFKDTGDNESFGHIYEKLGYSETHGLIVQLDLLRLKLLNKMLEQEQSGEEE